MSPAGFDRDAIVRALEAVGRRLDAEGLVGDVYVVVHVPGTRSRSSATRRATS